MKLETHSVNNGFVISISDSRKYDGEYVYRAVDLLPMIEFLGLVLLERKISVEEK